MEYEDICQELLLLAKKELEETESILPQDPIECFVLFTEMTRVIDYYSTANDLPTEGRGVTIQNLDIMRMGWNIAASHLLKPISVFGFPFSKSTIETVTEASKLLYKLGCTSLLKRSVDMIKYGLLLVEKSEAGFKYRKQEVANSQFLDILEFSHLSELENVINDSSINNYANWSLANREDIDYFLKKPGNFLSRNNEKEFSNFFIQDIDDHMLKQLRPWDSGHGLMIAYGSTIEIDFHFLAKATQLVLVWRDEAGFHPKVKIGEVTGAEIFEVMIYIVSFHLKHVHYASIASKTYPEIIINQSLTIWEPLNQLVNGISDFSGLSYDKVSKVLQILLMSSNDVNLLRDYTSKFMPLLIDIGNGFILRPVSSIERNPFFSILTLIEHRNYNSKHKILELREEWLRSYLYASFEGSRYQKVKGNIKLRIGNNVITDIDAAIYDNFTGELALFQIKWQDFHFNDVKKLRSRASNFTRELDVWAVKVLNWIKINGRNKLAQSLKLKSLRNKISEVYLFGLSMNVSRMQGYGFTTKENIAICNWPQFMRNRTEIGPADRVFQKIFLALKSQENETIIPKALPTKVFISNKVMDFEDLWATFDN